MNETVQRIIDHIDTYPSNLALTITDDWPPTWVDKLVAHYGPRAHLVIVNGRDTILIDKHPVKRTHAVNSLN